MAGREKGQTWRVGLVLAVQASYSPLFRILALVLIEYHDGGLLTTGHSWNLGRGRVLPLNAEVHDSVEYCTENENYIYHPKAKISKDWPSFWRWLVPYWIWPQ